MKTVTDDELIRERNLWEIYVAARRIPTNKLSQATSAVIFLLLAAYALRSPNKADFFALRTREVADYGFGFATAILSFLITGFAIYITGLKADLFLFLASTRNPKTDLPWLKESAFHFLRVMSVYVLFCLYCIAIKLFGTTNGPLSLVLSAILLDPEDNLTAKTFIAKICFSLAGSTLVHLVLLLQSFIYNIYASTMVAIVWERNRQVERSPSDPPALHTS